MSSAYTGKPRGMKRAQLKEVLPFLTEDMRAELQKQVGLNAGLKTAVESVVDVVRELARRGSWPTAPTHW